MLGFILRKLVLLKDYKYSLIIISSLGLVISLISFLFPVLNAHLITNLTEFNVSKILYFILLILFFQSMVHILRYILSIMFEKQKVKLFMELDNIFV